MYLDTFSIGISGFTTEISFALHLIEGHIRYIEFEAE